MKTHTPGKSSWMGYISQVKEKIGRDLSENEYKILMYRYLHSVCVNDVVKKLEEN